MSHLQPQPQPQPQPPQQQQQQFIQSIGQIQQQPQISQATQQMQALLQQLPGTLTPLQQQQILQQFQQNLQKASATQNGQQVQTQQVQTLHPQMQGFNPNMSQQNPIANMLLGAQQANAPGAPGAPATAPAWLQNLSMQKQNQSQTPMDILGLADKAAQALSGRAPAPMMANPNFPPPPPAPAPTFQMQQTVANEKDLPAMVQYAVQNLRTTGHIEQNLDSNLCSMLKRLPEQAALQALEIFSSCDLTKMRNRSSYLAGILKKELIRAGISHP